MQVIVIGHARGGTTATCGVVRALGINFPMVNERHEYMDIVKAFQREDVIWLKDFCDLYGSWGCKGLTLYDAPESLRHVREIFPNPKIITVWRDVYAIHEKGVLRTPQSPAELQQHLAKTIEIHMRIHKWVSEAELAGIPVHQLSYEKLVVNPSIEVRRIQRFLRLPEDGIDRAVRYIKPGEYGLWRDTK